MLRFLALMLSALTHSALCPYSKVRYHGPEFVVEIPCARDLNSSARAHACLLRT